jgi:dTDP-glucose 4,6-dehydratase
MARVVVSGGAGFLGSHLSDALLERGDEVVVLDNLVTGSIENIDHLFGRPGFTFVDRIAPVLHRRRTTSRSRSRR